MCFGVFVVLSLMISPGGDVSIFMEATTAVLWHLMVFLLLVSSGVLDSNFMSILGSNFMSVLDSDFLHI